MIIPGSWYWEAREWESAGSSRTEFMIGGARAVCLRWPILIFDFNFWFSWQRWLAVCLRWLEILTMTTMIGGVMDPTVHGMIWCTLAQTLYDVTFSHWKPTSHTIAFPTGRQNCTNQWFDHFSPTSNTIVFSIGRQNGLNGTNKWFGDGVGIVGIDLCCGNSKHWPVLWE